MINKVQLEILKFIFSFQYVNKSLLRLIGKSYDYNGRVVKSLFSNGLIEEIEINSPYKQRAVVITSKGIEYIKNEFQIEEDVLEIMKERVKGDEKKYRQYKLGTTMQMFYQFFPNFIDQFLKVEEKSAFNISTSLEDEINARKKSAANNFLITLKEMRDMDEYGLRKLTSTRAQGVVEFNNNLYAIYNHNKKRMKGHGDFEEKFVDYIESTFDEEIEGSINFAKSYQLVLDTFYKTPIKQRSNYILTKGIYKREFFVPLTYSGAKQMQIYNIKNFRNRVKTAILTDAEISAAQNAFYDGADDGHIFFLGFECDIIEIEKMLHLIETLAISLDIVIYCFPHQAHFYKTLFEDRAEINTLTIDQIVTTI